MVTVVVAAVILLVATVIASRETLIATPVGVLDLVPSVAAVIIRVETVVEAVVVVEVVVVTKVFTYYRQ